ncbi:APC family permease [Legionella sp. D16C41]|uniref:APC family permease n=1 Tax=Legionella sp. D16C41 TaxID=3402688 RepID=UPI003AF57B6F
MAKKLTSFKLALIIVCSVDSIRNLPAIAIIGQDLFLYFGLAFGLFLLPSAYIASWFTQYSDEGIYGWVKLSLSKKLGFIAISLQLMQNLFIFPTFLAFIAGLILYCLAPTLTQNNLLIFLIANGLIWGLTGLNTHGFALSSRLTVICALLGLIIPFIIILVIGSNWLILYPQALKTLPTNAEHSWAALTAIILSFCGIEIAAVHAKESKEKALPKAIALSVIIIFVTMLFGALTLALIIPAEQLNFITGIPELFHFFFKQINLAPLALLIDLLIIVGCLGCANNWLISPIKGLAFAAGTITDRRVHKALLLGQAAIVSIISSLFLFFPSLNASYWIMIVLATQMYLVMYFLMFIGAICLARRLKGNTNLRWQVLILASLGLVGSTIAFVVSFSPPATLTITPANYQLALLLSFCGTLTFIVGGYYLFSYKLVKLSPLA